jgi:hypothetical protein
VREATKLDGTYDALERELETLSAHRVRGMEGSVRRIANETVDDFIGDGRVELIGQFAIGLM